MEYFCTWIFHFFPNLVVVCNHCSFCSVFVTQLPPTFRPNTKVYNEVNWCRWSLVIVLALSSVFRDTILGCVKTNDLQTWFFWHLTYNFMKDTRLIICLIRRACRIQDTPRYIALGFKQILGKQKQKECWIASITEKKKNIVPYQWNSLSAQNCLPLYK